MQPALELETTRVRADLHPELESAPIQSLLRREEAQGKATRRRGIEILDGHPALMSRFHQHGDIEINYLIGGSLTYLFSGRKVTVGDGCLAVFWAAVPHRVVQIERDPGYYCIHLPLAIVLPWNLPDRLVEAILGGEMIVAALDEERAVDMMLMRQWVKDIRSADPRREQILHLEVEARLRRLALESALNESASDKVGPGESRELDSVESMAAFIARSYGQPIGVDDVAGHVDLHPKYAMKLFKRRLQMTVGQCITQHRVSHAQRLLATTDAGVLDIAYEAGFGSASRFYEAFQNSCGLSPRQFRSTVRSSS